MNKKKELNKWTDIPLRIRRRNIVKMSVLLIYLSIESMQAQSKKKKSSKLLCKYKKTDSKAYMERQKIQTANTVLKN